MDYVLKNGIKADIQYRYEPEQKAGPETEPICEYVEVTEIADSEGNDIYRNVSPNEIISIENHILQQLKDNRDEC